MKALEFFRTLVSSQKSGSPRGLCSVCSAHRTVLEAVFLQAARDGLPALVESTVNQVNQFGGYTGMTPEAFRDVVLRIADAMGFPPEQIILGADHVGPYPWRMEPAGEAMGKARDLVAASVRAGYEKIHLDASMPLGGDPTDGHGALDPDLIARREAELAEAAEKAFRDGPPGRSPPVYVIGTEVPLPGGIVSADEPVPLTRPDDLLQTVSLCRDAFSKRGLQEAWDRVCAVVAQPGVEYGDQQVHEYRRDRAVSLCGAARGLPGIVLEGHSTDYQSARCLRELVEDGIGVLKVGPGLTFALRECLFSLESIEGEMLRGRADRPLSNLAETLETAMLADPRHWKGYYAGDEVEQGRARRFSFSDRCRYYWAVPLVRESVERLVTNLRSTGIPLTVLSQFLPKHYEQIREGRLSPEPEALMRESVRLALEPYSFAVWRKP